MKKALITGTSLSYDQVLTMKTLGFDPINGTQAALELMGVPKDEQSRDLSEEEMCVLIKDVSVYVFGGLEAASEKIIEAASALELIAFMGTGWSDPGCVDADAVKRNNIPVTNTPHANAPSVAEMTIGLLIALERGVIPMNRATKNGNGIPMLRNDIAGKTLGVVGLGHIGSQVARHAVNGFGMKVQYSSPSCKPEAERSLGVSRVDLETLLATSDYITIHTPAHSTRGLIGSKEVAMLQPHALILNLSAPEVIDGNAIISSLEDGRIRGAAFDGFYKEPESLRERFLSLSDGKLIVLPRTAWLTVDSYLRMGQMALQSIDDLVHGKSSLSYQVN